MSDEVLKPDDHTHLALTVELPEYRPPLFLANGHLQSIIPTLTRRVPLPRYERERLTLPDGDFLDVDWKRDGNSRLVILSHGLGGHSHRWYISGMTHTFAGAGWDVAAWNARGCSGEINARPAFTHSGSSADLAAVVDDAVRRGVYRQIALVGFSMGGNITLLYLGRAGQSLPHEVCGATVFSVPCDLRGASEAIGRPGNRLYMKRFLVQLGDYLRTMSARFPDAISLEGYEFIRDFQDFDDRYTAPLHGFRDALDYWEKSSSRHVLKAITRPTWIVNALNDPFLSPSCFPVEEVATNPCIRLMTPDSGGHCGFMSFDRSGLYWSEEIAVKTLGAASGQTL
jgi:predicted alpha/beta-fold hydrolase